MHRNLIDNRVAWADFQAKKPREEMFNCSQLNSIDGYYVGLFEAHKIWAVTQVAVSSLHYFLDDLLKKQKDIGDKEIKDAINNGYTRLVQKWNQSLEESQEQDLPKAADIVFRSLIAIVRDNKIYIENASSSTPVILREEKDAFTFREFYYKDQIMDESNAKKLPKLVDRMSMEGIPS